MREAWFDARTLRPLGDGHINDTLLVESSRGRFVLQRINERVFPDPQALQEKVSRVVVHLQAAAPGLVPELEPTRRGEHAWRDEAGGLWRLWRYVENTRTLQELDNDLQAEAAGLAFGKLQILLRDFPMTVPDPIPGFMQLDHYLRAFQTALGAGVEAQADAADWVGFIDRRRGLAALFGVRDRLVHGDCKVNNLLFHEHTDRVASILDLDTVMSGHWAWDFGDLTRSVASGKHGVAPELFVALAKGFVAAGGINPSVEELLLAPRYVALMLGVRFLTDHLQGDRYFKVTARGENLLRARGQFALLEVMERQEARLRGLLRRI